MIYRCLFLIWVASTTFAQNTTQHSVHAHNDYQHYVAFWKSFAAGATSIEVDVFLEDETLFVAHEASEIKTLRQLENLYLKPVEKALELNMPSASKLQLLIDIKSEPYSTLNAIIKTLSKYPTIVNAQNLTLTISGNRPKVSEYKNYPDFISFDYQSLEPIKNPELLDKIAMVSLNFKIFSKWNGKGRLTASDLQRVKTVISKAKNLGKPFRFWATPDSKTAWKALADLGIDYINTDLPFECAAYLNTLKERVHENTSFSEVYQPTFEHEKQGVRSVENIILLIGDGNGLSQISATLLANHGQLSLTELKSIGLLKTQSSDDFTTDSAGAATAMATGNKVPNRTIGVDSLGKNVPNLTELLFEQGYETGIVTSDQITGATPAAFYAHQPDRSMAKAIRKDLLNSTLSFFISADARTEIGMDWGDFKTIQLQDLEYPKEKRWRSVLSEVNNLAISTKRALNALDKRKKPFFLLVEGAKIDSYGHENNVAGVIEEGIEFDRAITEALKYADANKRTLVLITADHETGGLSLPQGNVSKNLIEGDFTTDDHTGTLVPIFAYGPKAQTFQGVYDNHQLFFKILTALDKSNKD